MSIPHDDVIQAKLLLLLDSAKDGAMHCQDVYRILAEQFPELTKSELSDPYKSSVSKWANRVQFARLHLVVQGFILNPDSGHGRGYWVISNKGRDYINAPLPF